VLCALCALPQSPLSTTQKLFSTTQKLFSTTPKPAFHYPKAVISEHLRNIFNDNELDKEVVVRKFRTTTQHGAIEGKTQTHEVLHYNLDVIIALGYRVQSPIAVRTPNVFRGLSRFWYQNHLGKALNRHYYYVRYHMARRHNNLL